MMLFKSWNPTFHPLQLPKTTKQLSAPTLVQMCCDKIVSDSSLSLQGGITLPKTLIPCLLRTSLLKENYLASQALLPFWQEDTLILDEVLPQLLSNPKLLGDYDQQKIALKKACLASATVVTKWLSLIANEMGKTCEEAFHKDTFKIKKLDVSGLPFNVDILLKLLEKRKRPKTSIQPSQSNTYTIKMRSPLSFVLETIQFEGGILKIETVKLSSSIEIIMKRSPHLLHSMTTYLTYLDLSMTNLGNTGVINLLPIITNCVNLTGLDISKNNIQLHEGASQSSDAVSSLHNTIVNLPKLRRLNLSNNRLSGSLSTLLGTSLPLEYLNLNACVLRPTDFPHLPVSLIHLDLSENNILPLPLHLNKMNQLSILELEACKMSIQEIPSVGNFLRSLPKLSLINLAFTDFNESLDELLMLIRSKHINQVIISRQDDDDDGLNFKLYPLMDRLGKTLVWKGSM